MMGNYHVRFLGGRVDGQPSCGPATAPAYPASCCNSFWPDWLASDHDTFQGQARLRVWKQYAAVVQAWHADLLFQTPSLRVTGVISE